MVKMVKVVKIAIRKKPWLLLQVPINSVPKTSDPVEHACDLAEKGTFRSKIFRTRGQVAVSRKNNALPENEAEQVLTKIE